MLNLITDPWLPIRRLSGDKADIRPCDITSDFAADPILALDFPRPDWNAAVTELLIGLLATVMAPDDTKAWADTWAKPPSPADLEKRLAPLAFAFNLGGDGPRCFQDLDPLSASDEKPITALLIDAPGENTEEKNTDLFVKRDAAAGFSLSHASAILVTMQTYAPSGGQGNRTSMRGAGPLTTLPMPRRKIDFDSRVHMVTTLWDLIWSSVPERARLGAIPTTSYDPGWRLIFPWLDTTRTSEDDQAVTPEGTHPLQQFFGMPRRIRLELGATGSNAIRPNEVTIVRQKNYGVMYSGWMHHLSPYYFDKKSGLLPSHPQADSATYRDWLTWVETPTEKTSQRAACLDAWRARLDDIKHRFADGGAFESVDPWQSSVQAWGYDIIKNMKARSWLEARIPYFDPPFGADPDAWPQHFITQAKNLSSGAREASSVLVTQTRLATFGAWDGRTNRYVLPKKSAGKKAFSDVVERFWRETEKEFRDALATLRRGTAADPNDPRDTDRSVRGDFLKALRRKALDLFDEIVGVDLMDKEARRIVEARTRLLRAFNETGSVQDALDIMTEEARQRKKTRKSKRKEAA